MTIVKLNIKLKQTENGNYKVKVKQTNEKGIDAVKTHKIKEAELPQYLGKQVMGDLVVPAHLVEPATAAPLDVVATTKAKKKKKK